MLVFIDVGAYHGERTVEAVELDIFDEVHAFEPSLEAFQKLAESVPLMQQKTSILLYNAGLWNKEGRFPLYRCGSAGGTLFKGKERYGESPHDRNIQPCRFIRASKFLSTFSKDTGFVIKLNCEGAECDIIHDILHFAGRIRCMAIDFDCLKVPGKAQEAAQAMKALTLCQIPFAEMSNLTTKNRMKMLAEIFLGEYL